MLRRLNKMTGFAIHTTDGRVGHVDDFYFDIETWNVRYLVVKTGPWLFGRSVLISPVAMEEPNWEAEALFLNLTQEQVKSSPEMALDLPITRQYERTLNSHYGWPNYWAMGPAQAAAMPTPFVPVEAEAVARDRVHGDVEQPGQGPQKESDGGDEAERNYVRSVKDTHGYTIQAVDQEIGYIDDFFADETDWKIRYALVDTSRWLGGKDVLISPDWIDDVDWVERLVRVHVTHEQVENSPEYDAREPLHRDHEVELYSHYGYPMYWGV